MTAQEKDRWTSAIVAVAAIIALVVLAIFRKDVEVRYVEMGILALGVRATQVVRRLIPFANGLGKEGKS